MDKRLKQIMKFKQENCYCTTLKECRYCEILNELIPYLVIEIKKELEEPAEVKKR